MGRGVGPGRFDQARAAEIEEQEVVQEAIQFQSDPNLGPVVKLLIQEMEATMLRIYMEHPDGQAQTRLFKQLQMRIDPSTVIKNLVRKRMGAPLSALADAAP
jgi:hypothetical protein